MIIRIWILFICILIINLFLTASIIHAVDVNITSYPVSQENFEFELKVLIKGAKKATNYLKINTGETWNGSGWYSGGDFKSYLPVKIDSKEFNESVLAKMINYLIDKEQKKKNIDKPSESLGFAKNIDLSGLYTKQLIEKLSTFSKTEEYEMKIEKIASTVQRYFEVRFGREYSKPILTKAVGEFLTSAGFSKKQRRMQSGRSMVWNISEASLVELEAFIDSFIPTEAAVVQEQSVVPVVFEECPQEFLEIPTEPSFKSVGTTNKAINSGLCKPFKLLSEVELESFFESVDMNILLIKKEFKPINL